MLVCVCLKGGPRGNELTGKTSREYVRAPCVLEEHTYCLRVSRELRLSVTKQEHHSSTHVECLLDHALSPDPSPVYRRQRKLYPERE